MYTTAAVCVIVVAGCGVWLEYKNALTFRELEHYVLPVDDVSSLSRDEARLYRYLLETRLSPLFAIPGSDTEAMRTALDALEKSRDAFLTSFDLKERQLLREHLYPIAFLRSLADTEDARRAFLGDPSSQNSEHYHNSLLHTIDEYQTAIATLRDTVRSYDEKTLGFWQGITSTHFIEETLDTVFLEATARMHEETRRYRCLSFGLWCKSLSGTQGDLQSEPDVSTLDSLPPTIERNLRVVDARADRPPETLTQWGGEEWKARGAYALATLAHPTTFKDLPVAFLNNSKCAVHDEPTYVRFWWSTSRASDIPTARIAILNDLYFRDLAHATSEFEQTLYEMGIPYIFQPTNPFICIDFGIDISTVFSAYYIQNELAAQPIFSAALETNDNDTLKTLAAIENTLRTSGRVLDVSLIESYISRAEDLVNRKGERDLASLLEYADVRRIERFVEIWNAKSAWLEYIVGYLDDESITTRLLSQFRDMSMEEMILTRSYISSLYLFSNETIISSPVSLVEKRERFDLSQLDLISYNQTLSAQYSPQEMVRYILISDTAINTLKE